VLIVSARGERRRLAGERTYQQPWLEYSSLVSFDAKGEVSLPMNEATAHAGEPDDTDEP
jgi:hypothetical protein